MQDTANFSAKKASILNILAIVGLLVILTVAAWAAVMLIQTTPSAVSSLASLADGVNQYQEATAEPATNDVFDIEPTDVAPVATSTDSATDTVSDTDEAIAVEEVEEVVAETTVETPAVAETTPTPTIPATERVYLTPVSDPTGTPDLAARYIAVGQIVDGAFVLGLANKAGGAVQFEVKNIGTKDSDTWSYSVTLPDGTTHTSGTELLLKPNERTILTLGFGASAVDTHTFAVAVTTTNDANENNNTFTHTTIVMD